MCVCVWGGGREEERGLKKKDRERKREGVRGKEGGER